MRGFGSSNTQVQKNYFAALVSLVSSNKMRTEFSAKCIHDVVEAELHISGNIAKGVSNLNCIFFVSMTKVMSIYNKI